MKILESILNGDSLEEAIEARKKAEPMTSYILEALVQIGEKKAIDGNRLEDRSVKTIDVETE